jgi:alpha-L-fucosidase
MRGILCLLVLMCGAQVILGQGSRTFDVLHYDVSLEPDITAKTIKGTVTIKYLATIKGLTKLELDCGDLVIDAVKQNGQARQFSVANRKVTISLAPNSRPTGEVQVDYHGTPRRGIRFFPERQQVYTVFSTSQWMVCVDAPDDRATLTLRLSVPPNLKTVGNGRLKTAQRLPNGVLLNEWEQTTPVPTYIFGFAIGPFDELTEKNKFTYLTTGYSEAEVRQVFKNTGDMFKFFEAKAGVPYAGKTYTQVLAAGGVEQEMSSFTALPEAYGKRLLANEQDVWLAAHEMAHQWWGNMVTCRDWNHFWLNEGIATFMAAAYIEHRFGSASYEKEINRYRESYERVRAAGKDKSLVFPDWLSPTPEDRTLVYDKGAYVMHLLRQEMGEQKFWRGLRLFTRRHFGKPVVTADFTAAMSEANGKSLEKFFAKWVYNRSDTATNPVPYGPTPSARQLRWHELEFYGFLHFTVNTFTDKEWGYGDESPSTFNPTAFDADQIVRTAKAAGMKGLILTAKHHDGFCLWPSKYTKHSVQYSQWRGGKGDVVRDISAACRRHGLKFGIYLSPWDRNHKDYGKPEYITYFRNQMRELLTNYGPVFEVFLDGANGGDGYYGGARETRKIDRETYYDWSNTWSLIRKLQPDANIFSDAGPDVRWVGNERGIAGETCWATLNREEFVPGRADEARLNSGDRPGTHWVPAECDVSIRPGWFYHSKEDDKVRSGENLLDLYFKSVGRGASFLLNLPVDRRGQIHANDVKALQDFRRLLDHTFSRELSRNARVTASHSSPRFAASRLTDNRRYTYWTTSNGFTLPEVVIDLGREQKVNVVRIREYLPLGQRVEAFAVDVWSEGTWKEVATGTSIGNSRLVRLSGVETSKIRLRITKTAAAPALSEFSLFGA